MNTHYPVPLGDNHEYGPSALLRDIFSGLEASGVEYAVIHSAPGSKPDVTSDIDIAFAADPRIVLEPVLRDLSSRGLMLITQRLHYDVPHAYYYILAIPGDAPQFLHLDCLHDPLGINRYQLTTRELLADRVRTAWGYRSADKPLTLYLLIKKAKKTAISDWQLEELRRLIHNGDNELLDRIRRTLGRRSGPKLEQLLAANGCKQAQPILAEIRKHLSAQFFRDHPFRLLRRIVHDTIRRVRRALKPTGLFVVLMGPDGSGKSTVADLLLAQLARAFRRTHHFHWRPGLFPPLKRRGKNSATQTSHPPSPTDASKYGVVVSLIRFTYYWLDFVLGYWLLLFPRRAQTTLIVGERYFPDILVHPERYAFRLPQWLMRLAARFVPSPDLLILLTADPAAIYRRKQELAPETIASQLASYQQELRHWPCAMTVDTQAGATVAAGNIGHLVCKCCAMRLSPDAA